MYEGWVMIHRKIKNNWLFTQKRVFSDFEAWIDLILSANHCDNTFKHGKALVKVKRGGMITSVRGLGERWNWSRTKVSDFLDLLQSDGMILYKSDTKKTVINIVSYSIYQDGDYEKNATEVPHKSHANDTEVPRECRTYDTLMTHKDTNNNDNNDNNEKNDKNEKKKYAEFVSMTSAEYQKLVAAYGKDKVQRMIEVLDNYKGSNGKKYKSDYRAVQSWVAERVLNEKSKVIAMPNAGAYRDESQKCPRCRDSGWVLDENSNMARCSCQEVSADG